MVLEPKIFDFIEGDSTVFEKAPLEKCAELGELKAYNYNGLRQCMDTKREMEKLGRTRSPAKHLGSHGNKENDNGFEFL